MKQEMNKGKGSNKKTLRRVLILCILVLVVVAAGIGLLMWKNSSSADVGQSQTASIAVGEAGVDNTEFAEIPEYMLPDLNSCYGKKMKTIKKELGSYIKAGKVTKGSDPDRKKVKYLCSVQINSKDGIKVGTATFKLNKKKQVIYITATFDMDALGVADADFQKLASSRLVAATTLISLGVDPYAVAQAPLDTNTDPSARTDSGEKSSCKFGGTTGAKKKTVIKKKKVVSKKTGKKKVKKVKTKVQVAFMKWRLIETYDYTQRQASEQGSVVRKITVKLF